MHFEFGDRRYIVTIAARPLILLGQPCRAKFDPVGRRVMLSDQLPRHERRRELFHELRHCWVDAHGVAADHEADADDSSRMMDCLLDQYLQQGGDATLETMDPPAAASTSRAPVGAMAQVVAHCGECAAPMAVGSIAGGAPRWSDDAGTWLMDRGLLCEVCDRVTVWCESCTAEGMPTGNLAPYPAPCVLAGREAATWISEHRRECRVVMA